MAKERDPRKPVRVVSREYIFCTYHKVLLFGKKVQQDNAIRTCEGR